MSENGFAGASSLATISPASSVTYYGNYGNSAAATTTLETTEANAQVVHRGSNVTVKGVRVLVITNGRAATSSVTTRLNGADTSQAVSITASTTGTFVDTTNNVSVTSGDTVGYKLVVGSTSGSFYIASITANFESAGQAQGVLSAIGTVSTTTASVTRHYVATGNLATAQSTEAGAQSALPAAGVLSNLRVYVSAARATATTFRTRVNGANGAQSVSITGTGAFEDTTHSDTVAVGDLLTVSTVTGTGTDTLTLVHSSLLYTPSTATVSPVMSGPTSTVTLSAAVTRYYNPQGLCGASTAEAGSQQLSPLSGTASNFAIGVSTNGSTSSTTWVFRIAGVDTALTFTVPATTSGYFSDTTHSASIATGDLLSVKGSGGSTATLSFRSLGFAFAAANVSQSAGSATAGATAAGVGASTANSAGAAVAGAVASGVGSSISNSPSTGSATASGTASGVGASTASAAGSATATVTGAGVSAFFTVGAATATVTASGAGASLVASTGTATATVTADASSPSTGRARRLVLIMA